jgi:hypothetical protein
MKPKRTQMILSSLVISLMLLSSACSLSSDQNSDPSEASIPPLSEDIDSLVMLAKFDLTLKTGVDIEKIETVSVDETNFSDASLGVPEPGVEYAAVITPGYIIILNADGDTYEYHASGEKVVQVP